MITGLCLEKIWSIAPLRADQDPKKSQDWPTMGYAKLTVSEITAIDEDLNVERDNKPYHANITSQSLCRAEVAYLCTELARQARLVKREPKPKRPIPRT